jgi:hypothetical protein
MHYRSICKANPDSHRAHIQRGFRLLLAKADGDNTPFRNYAIVRDGMNGLEICRLCIEVVFANLFLIAIAPIYIVDSSSY